MLFLIGESTLHPRLQNITDHLICPCQPFPYTESLARLPIIDLTAEQVLGKALSNRTGNLCVDLPPTLSRSYDRISLLAQFDKWKLFERRTIHLFPFWFRWFPLFYSSSCIDLLCMISFYFPGPSASTSILRVLSAAPVCNFRYTTRHMTSQPPKISVCRTLSYQSCPRSLSYACSGHAHRPIPSIPISRQIDKELYQSE